MGRAGSTRGECPFLPGTTGQARAAACAFRVRPARRGSLSRIRGEETTVIREPTNYLGAFPSEVINDTNLVAFWWNRDTLPSWAKAAPSAGDEHDGCGHRTSATRPVTAVGCKRKAKLSGFVSRGEGLTLDGWELTPTVSGATCSSLLRVKLLPSTWRELRLCVGEVGGRGSRVSSPGTRPRQAASGRGRG
jgi:hypothetical protein